MGGIWRISPLSAPRSKPERVELTVNDESERIVELERRLHLVREKLVAEVLSSTELCARFEEELTRMNAEVSRLQRQRGVYWKSRSLFGRALRRLGLGPK